MISLVAKNYEEFEDIVYSKTLNISQTVVDKILNNLETNGRYIYILKIQIEDNDEAIDFTIDRNNFIEVLEKNIKIQEHFEQYECCAEIRDTINQLKNK